MTSEFLVPCPEGIAVLEKPSLDVSVKLSSCGGEGLNLVGLKAEQAGETLPVAAELCSL